MSKSIPIDRGLRVWYSSPYKQKGGNRDEERLDRDKNPVLKEKWHNSTGTRHRWDNLNKQGVTVVFSSEKRLSTPFSVSWPRVTYRTRHLVSVTRPPYSERTPRSPFLITSFSGHLTPTFFPEISLSSWDKGLLPLYLRLTVCVVYKWHVTDPETNATGTGERTVSQS